MVHLNALFGHVLRSEQSQSCVAVSSGEKSSVVLSTQERNILIQAAFSLKVTTLPSNAEDPIFATIYEFVCDKIPNLSYVFVRVCEHDTCVVSVQSVACCGVWLHPRGP